MIFKLVAAAAAAVALVLAVSTWFLTQDGRHWSDRAFDSCAVQGGQLVLRFGFGAGDDLRTSVRPRDGHFEVRLEAHTADGPAPAILLHGEARLDGWSVGREAFVLQNDGKRLNCPTIVGH